MPSCSRLFMRLLAHGHHLADVAFAEDSDGRAAAATFPRVGEAGVEACAGDKAAAERGGK